MNSDVLGQWATQGGEIDKFEPEEPAFLDDHGHQSLPSDPLVARH